MMGKQERHSVLLYYVTLISSKLAPLKNVKLTYCTCPCSATLAHSLASIDSCLLLTDSKEVVHDLQ